jgi:antitoxin HigA-1
MNLDMVPIHPGEILNEVYLKELGMSAGALAKHLNVPRTRIERIVAQETGITIDTALRLSRFFNTSVELWINMQKGYELRLAHRNPPKNLDKIQPMQMQTLIAAE